MNPFKSTSRSIKFLIILIALFAITLPVLFAIYQSWQFGKTAESQKVLAYANDVLTRTDITANQIADGIKILKKANLEPCSQKNLALMRDIDLASTYIQAIGFISNGFFECSSQVELDTNWDIGPVDFVSSRGAAFRTNVKLPDIPNSTFTVVELSSYGAIINNNLPIDATTAERDVSLAVFSQDNNNHLILSRGIIKPEWIKELGNQTQTTFFKNGYTVAIVKSTKYRTVALAALPSSYLDQNTRHLAIILAPIGLLAGFILAAAVYYLAKTQVSMPSIIKWALRNNEFFMLYQPVVCLQTGTWVGAEALVRWLRPNGKFIPPDAFIQVAEDFDLIQKITKRVIQLVSKDATDLFQKYPEFHLGINLSAADLHSTDTIALLRDLIQQTGANHQNLIVEATERGLMRAELARTIISEIRKNGLCVAIDDFGTGYSSLSQLESFEIDYLKIDKSFVDKIGTDAPTSFVVLHIIEMAKELNMKMIAEGVETEAQAQFLRDHGVQYAQGWLYSKAIPMADLLSNLAKVNQEK